MRTLLASVFLFVVSVSPVHAFEEEALKNLKLLRKCVKCDLSGVDLHGQNLKQVDINKANLSGAKLTRVWLRATNLSGANLTGADLTKAELDGVDLNGTNLSDVDLTKAILKNVKMDGAILCRTKLPQGEDNSGCK